MVQVKTKAATFVICDCHLCRRQTSSTHILVIVAVIVIQLGLNTLISEAISPKLDTEILNMFDTP